MRPFELVAFLDFSVSVESAPRRPRRGTASARELRTVANASEGDRSHGVQKQRRPEWAPEFWRRAPLGMTAMPSAPQVPKMKTAARSTCRRGSPNAEVVPRGEPHK